MKSVLRKLMVAAMVFSGSSVAVDPDSRQQRPSSHVAREEWEDHANADDLRNHPDPAHLLRDHEAHHADGELPHADGSEPEPPRRHSKPSHVGGSRRRRRRRRRETHPKGDGSKPSHAYDYIYDELEEMREELIDTEDTFGHDSDEVYEIMSKMRTLEQIQRNSKMLNQGMPQSEFDDLVQWITRLAELRLFEHVNGPGSLRKRRERAETYQDDPDGDPEFLDPDDPDHDHLYGDEHDEEYEEGKRERSQEMMQLGEDIREAEEHWKVIQRPMVHDATKEQRKEIHDVYKQLKTVTNREDRKIIRDKLEHLQALIHDRRRHKDMDAEDVEAIKALREEALLAETDEEKHEITEEIEDIYRDHRKKVQIGRASCRERV